ncbi:MAG TPA: peroxiredoxin [Candidatus Saccharimonadales bacterium]|nr:peroxiredoxin [Candidatus Saccharimonadales bacterium]
MRTNLIATLVITGLALLAAPVHATPMPKVGDTAPLFSGQDQYGKTINLADLIGKKIVLLYFYPKSFTPGCTTEACGFRDRMGELQKDNVEVIGVSFDTVARQKAFTDKYNLNFPLIGDPDGKIVELYGVRIDHMDMAHRVSFLIGLDGKIVHVTDAGNPEVHFEQMKAAIAALINK